MPDLSANDPQLRRALDPAVVDEPIVDSLLTAEELQLRGELRQVVAAHVAPAAADLDRTHQFAEAGYQALAQAGFGGLLFPVELGGSARSTVAHAIAVEEISRACGATSLIYMTQMHAAYPILVAGSDEQQRRFIPGLCRGTLYGSLAITEPMAGSDVSALRTHARPDSEHYVLEGSKTFITTGDRADVIICFATIDASRGRDGVTAFVVPGDAPGLRRGSPMHKMGMHGSTTAELFFDGVRVPASARLGDEGGAWMLSMHTVVKSRISAAAQGLGLATAAYEHALGWAQRRGFLRGAEHQAKQFRLADIRSRLQAARLHLHSVSRAVDAGSHDASTDVSMAKYRCTDLGFDVANQVVEMLGGEGDLRSNGAERLLRDVKVTQIYDGTNEIQRLLVARDIASRVEVAR